ncbi:uncharacterized protein V1518DRAFT_378789 [Limtongia smithiae]|uniref:uncharacterized protein n=1 Tax=Limtongia smithiae TaxID=1125753 RepID=UPI0034CDD29C
MSAPSTPPPRSSAAAAAAAAAAVVLPSFASLQTSPRWLSPTSSPSTISTGSTATASSACSSPLSCFSSIQSSCSPATPPPPLLPSLGQHYDQTQFSFTTQVRPLYCAPVSSLAHNLAATDTMFPVSVSLRGSIPRGLRYESARWLAYRRNYFYVMATASLDIPFSSRPQPWMSRDGMLSLPPLVSSLAGHALYVALDNGGKRAIVRVRHFAVCVRAEDEISHRGVPLVQRTPKRDSGPTRTPRACTMVPVVGDSESRILAEALRACRTIVRSAPMPATQPRRYYSEDEDEEDSEDSVFGQPASATEVVCYERLQFHTATANNGRNNTSQQLFRLVLTMYAAVRADDCPAAFANVSPDSADVLFCSENPELRLVALQSVSTSGIVVRGRSPGHYSRTAGLIK